MVLELCIFLKKNRYRKIKVRIVAGGKKHCTYTPKEDPSSPTVITESVLLPSIVDAKENRDAAFIDIPNTFIQTLVEEKKYTAIIKLNGFLVDIQCEISS